MVENGQAQGLDIVLLWPSQGVWYFYSNNLPKDDDDIEMLLTEPTVDER